MFLRFFLVCGPSHNIFMTFLFSILVCPHYREPIIKLYQIVLPFPPLIVSIFLELKGTLLFVMLWDQPVCYFILINVIIINPTYVCTYFISFVTILLIIINDVIIDKAFNLFLLLSNRCVICKQLL